MRKLLLASTMLLGLLAPASADITLGGQNWSFNGVDTLSLTAVVPSGNQPQNIQCVICGENQPQQSPTFGYTDFQNTGQPNQDLRYFSTAVNGGGNPGIDTVGVGYSGDFLRAFLLAGGDPTLTFSIGVDVNDSNSAQTLNSFFLLNLTTHTVLAAYTGGTTGNVPAINDGTGFPDYTLGTFNITLGTDIHQNDQLIFFARLSDANDGPDSFFLIPQIAAVPGPIAGAGIPGLIAACAVMFGLHRRRRKTA